MRFILVATSLVGLAAAAPGACRRKTTTASLGSATAITTVSTASSSSSASSSASSSSAVSSSTSIATVPTFTSPVTTKTSTASSATTTKVTSLSSTTSLSTISTALTKTSTASSVISTASTSASSSSSVVSTKSSTVSSSTSTSATSTLSTSSAKSSTSSSATTVTSASSSSTASTITKTSTSSSATSATSALTPTTSSKSSATTSFVTTTSTSSSTTLSSSTTTKLTTSSTSQPPTTTFVSTTTAPTFTNSNPATASVTNPVGLTWYDSSLTNGVAGRNPSSGNYYCYSGPAINFPPRSNWTSFETMWTLLSQVALKAIGDTPEQVQEIRDAIIDVSQKSKVDARIILATIVLESTGNVNVACTTSPGPDHVRNCGLMQAFNSSSYNPNDSANSIHLMVQDGTQGTIYGPGIVQLLNGSPLGTGHVAGNVFAAMRAYNSGSINDANLSDGRGAGPAYVSNIANFVQGWAGFGNPGPDGCDFTRLDNHNPSS